MNRASLLHIIERLEGFLGKLPATIQKPVLHELTPLKELFLQQRPPRFVLTGSNKFPVQEVVATLFAWAPPAESRDVLMELFRWQTIDLGGHGTIALLDARGADATTIPDIEEELKRQPADIFLHLGDEARRRDAVRRANSTIWRRSTLRTPPLACRAKVIGIVLHESGRAARGTSQRRNHPRARNRRARSFKARFGRRTSGQRTSPANLRAGFHPADASAERNEARRAALHVAARARTCRTKLAWKWSASRAIARRRSRSRKSLVKSTTAICAAIGAQPIPLADLPILTTLQLVMVSGIMYISGRERSLRAATEFVARARRKRRRRDDSAGRNPRAPEVFSGWGNVVCGMVAGAGTYAIGRATIVYFLEGVSLKDARRTYLASRKKRAQREPARIREIEAAALRELSPTCRPSSAPMAAPIRRSNNL